MSTFVDLHAHHLFALDDGAISVEMALQSVNALAALGFKQLYATPHQRSGMFLPAWAEVTRTFEELRQRLAVERPELSVGLGAENFWDDVLHQRLGDGTLPAYDGGRAFLFEINPRLWPVGLDRTLFGQRVAGRLPVMAHPERYSAIQENTERAAEIGRTTALLIDLGALEGAHGKAEMRTARRLLEEGLVHAAASDIHRPEDQRTIAAGMAWIKKHFGDRALSQLLDDGPRHILAGELPDPFSPGR